MNFGSPEVYLPRTFGTSLKDRHMQRVQRERGTEGGGEGKKEGEGREGEHRFQCSSLLLLKEAKLIVLGHPYCGMELR